VLAQCENRVGMLSYGPSAEEMPPWICNMPLEEQTGEAILAPNMVEAASHKVSEWQAAKAGGPVGAAAGVLTLHTMMQAGPVNLGWTTTNRFTPIAGTDDAATPSEVTNNA
jgi:hypothetical protein